MTVAKLRLQSLTWVVADVSTEMSLRQPRRSAARHDYFNALEQQLPGALVVAGSYLRKQPWLRLDCKW